MPILDAKELLEQLKAGKIANLYYFYGSDVLQVERCTKAVLKALTGSAQSDGVTKFDGQNLDISQLADESALCPMFADYNCLYIHDCDMEALRENDRKALMQVLEDVPSGTVLIFDVTGFDIYGGKTGKNKKPSARNKKIIDYIAKHGTVCCMEPKTLAATATGIIAAAKKNGCSMERTAAQTLAAQCGCQSLLIRQELGKLCAYADGGEITEAMVLDMVTPQLETTVYALTKAVLAHRAADAMRAVDELLAMRVEMPYLMATISGCLIDLQRAAAARRSGKTVQDMMSDFSYRFSFTVENAFRDSMHEAPEQIARCLRLLCRAEMKMHSAAVNERVLLEQTIAEMLQS